MVDRFSSHQQRHFCFKNHFISFQSIFISKLWFLRTMYFKSFMHTKSQLTNSQLFFFLHFPLLFSLPPSLDCSFLLVPSPCLSKLTYQRSHFLSNSRTMAQSEAQVTSKAEMGQIDAEMWGAQHFLVTRQANNWMTPPNPGTFYAQILKAAPLMGH